MNHHLSSADRALIARITDLAIDVTAQGRYEASAFYHSNSNSFVLGVTRVRADTASVDTVASSFRHDIALPNGPQDAAIMRERSQTLAQMTRFLETLLEVPEARS